LEFGNPEVELTLMRFTALKNPIAFVMGILCLLFLLCSFAHAAPYTAGNASSVQLFMDNHPLFKAGSPSNTQTSGTTVLTYSGQPANGEQLTINYAGNHERFQFYTGSSYSGDAAYTGIHIESAMDDTYANLVTYVNAHSRLTHIVHSTGANTLTFRGVFRGSRANYIHIDSSDVSNISPAADTFLTSGASAQGLYPGEMVYDTLTGTAWIRLGTDQGTDPAWRVFNRELGQFQFGDTDCADSQSTVEWGTGTSADVGGSIKRVVAPKSGSIIGVSVIGNTACTSGSLVVAPTIDGTAISMTSGLNTHAGSTITSYTTQVYNVTGSTFTAGQAIGVKATTASWLPVTDDVGVTVFVEYN
jgi:hypothetical protein